MISNTEPILLIYSTGHIRVKVYLRRGPGDHSSRRAGMQVFLAGAMQSAARSGRFSGAVRIAGPKLGLQAKDMQ